MHPQNPKQLGLELNTDHTPVVPTIVYAQTRVNYDIFAGACEVKTSALGNYVDLLFITESSNAFLARHETELFNVSDRWQHIAFVGIDPRGYWVNSSVWRAVEHLRVNKQFKKAFYYPEWSSYYIQPNIREEGRI